MANKINKTVKRTIDYPKGIKCEIVRFRKQGRRWVPIEVNKGIMPTTIPKLDLGSVQTLRRNGELEIVDYDLGTKLRYTPLNTKNKK